MRVLAAPFLFPGLPPSPWAALIRDAAVALDGDRILAAGPRAEVEARFGRGEPVDAVLLPALVNAHLHLELSHLAGRVPGGDGLAGWIGRFLRARAETPDDPAAAAAAAASLVRAGVAAVGDVANGVGSVGALAAAGLAGSVFHEVFGLSEERVSAAREAARAARASLGPPAPGLRIVPSPHAVYSTNPGALAELLGAGPASVHLAEDPAEREFVASGGGPLAPLMAALGAARDRPRGRSAVACAAPALHAASLGVHLVDLDAEDRAALRRSGATAVLCPRSNLHIGGRLPDLPALLEAGVPLAVGTDSLASSPSLSPLAELAALARAFPRVPAARLLPLAWNGACVGAPAVGRLAPGAAPGLLAAPLGGDRPADPAAWLLEACGAGERSLAWIARHRPEAAA